MQRKKSASPKSAPRKKPAPVRPKPRTNSAHYKPAPRKKPAGPRWKTAARKSAPLPIRQPPPPREADPVARQTGARLA
ncbi:MAG TPA: hypothetical protein VN803_03985, partial [Gemmatimonadales bacterium]|nr:hypothetical protein [Gemmatimonadales bacterium]